MAARRRSAKKKHQTNDGKLWGFVYLYAVHSLEVCDVAGVPIAGVVVKLGHAGDILYRLYQERHAFKDVSVLGIPWRGQELDTSRKDWWTRFLLEVSSADPPFEAAYPDLFAVIPVARTLTGTQKR